MTARNYYASECIGKNIRNAQNEDLGKVEDMVISPEGNAEFIVVSFGGIFGTTLNDKLLAIPYEQFGWDDSDNELTLNMTKDQMEAAPNFDKDNVPQSNDNYFTSSRDYYRNNKIAA